MKEPADDDEGDKDSVTSEYEMVSDLFDYNKLRSHDNFAIKKYKNGTIYRGEINEDNGKR